MSVGFFLKKSSLIKTNRPFLKLVPVSFDRALMVAEGLTFQDQSWEGGEGQTWK